MRKEAKVLTFFISRVQRVVFQRLFKVPQGIQGKGNSAMHTKSPAPEALQRLLSCLLLIFPRAALEPSECGSLPAEDGKELS